MATSAPQVQPNQLPIGTILPLYKLPTGPLPAGWGKCDGSDPNCPNLSGQFLCGSSAGQAIQSKGGSATATVPHFGSNNNTPDGNGWSLDGSHYRSNDVLTVPTVPPFTAVLYIMRYQ
jgi:hypothetical protein